MPVIELPCLDGAGETWFPSTDKALGEPNGLLAWGGNLSPERLLSAYRKGIFPWFSDNEPVLWWTPSPRCVLHPEQVYISTRTRRRLRQGAFRISADTAFSEVIKACAEPGIGRLSTWITDQMLTAYKELHRLGVAHCVEVWKDDQLIGGIYGLAIGHMFFGESMFSRESDASKIALVYLCQQLQDWGFGPLDCQVGNGHLYRMGAIDLARGEFEQMLAKYTSISRPNESWQRSFSTRRSW